MSAPPKRKPTGEGSFLEQLDHAVLMLEGNIKRRVSQYYTNVLMS